MPEVSIVIPAYNVEKYIVRCVDSCIAQTFTDFEIIIVNDGSTDKTLEMCGKYDGEQRVRVIDQPNGGPSVARNRGMDEARGKYIMFIDSDDYIDPDYIESYVSAISAGGYDAVMGGYKKVTGEHVDFVRCPDGKKFSRYLVMGPVAKIYSADFLKRHALRFPITTASEDVYFNAMFINAGARIGYIRHTGYYYYFNPASLSNTAHKGFSESVDILELMNAINYPDINERELHEYFIIRYIIWYLLYSGKNVSKQRFMQEYGKYFDWLEKNIPAYRHNKYIRPLGREGEQKSIGFIIFAFMTAHKLHLTGIFASLYCREIKH